MCSSKPKDPSEESRSPEYAWQPAICPSVGQASNEGKATASDPVFTGVADEFTGLHWHGEIFSLPPGAAPLASSAVTQYQAFGMGPLPMGCFSTSSSAQLDFDTRNDVPILQSMGSRSSTDGRSFLQVYRAGTISATRTCVHRSLVTAVPPRPSSRCSSP